MAMRTVEDYNGVLNSLGYYVIKRGKVYSLYQLGGNYPLKSFDTLRQLRVWAVSQDIMVS